MRTDQLVVVRHGETEWSRLHKHTGHSDIALTELGREQARIVRDALGGRRFDRVLVSPLSRALETCRLAGYGDQAEPHDDLREWDYGVYEGTVTDEVRKDQPGWSVWESEIPEGEDLAAVSARVDRLIADIRAHPGYTLAFAHGHLLRVLAARWAGLPPETGRRLMLSTAGIGVLGYEHAEPAIVRWNEVGHLERD